MPRLAPKPCANPLCSALVPMTARYCDKHRRDHERARTARRREDPVERSLLDFYNSRLWRTFRLNFLADNALCEACKREGRLTPATVVDHVVPVKAGGDRLDVDNCQALCASHHAGKSARERQVRL